MTTNTQHTFDAQLRHFASLPPLEGRVAAFTYVRDLAYGDIGSRNPLDVLAAQKGTCSGKHALLKLFLEGLGYDVQSWFALHDFAEFPLARWPDELGHFREKTLTDFHDFLKIKLDEDWITIDAIFDAPLKAFGFPAMEWDGATPIALPIKARETFPSEGPMEDHKKKLLAALPEQVQKDRKAFLGALTAWLDEKRNG